MRLQGKRSERPGYCQCSTVVVDGRIIDAERVISTLIEEYGLDITRPPTYLVCNFTVLCGMRTAPQ
jgi:hypothetical protein